MHLDRPYIVAVDGPAGSGKSSICAGVCKALGWSYVNTGALYRAIGVLANMRRIELYNDEPLHRLVEEFCERARWDHHNERLYFGDTDLTDQLGSVSAATGASLVAKMPQVRDLLLPLQRKLSLTAPVGAIVDGRDIGTVVFPDAHLKVFLTASLEQRAMRRLRQLEASGQINKMTKLEIMQAIESRDHQDSQREAAPLKMADDALLLDTSDLTIDEAKLRLIEILKQRSLVS
jgi:CMP/dCMP kinase